jgi:beta-1,4-mannosyl-glycoprotein beta-1,4-N-acetylglucosaminyltransferase
MIYDCFLFFKELDILELRLRLLYDSVDKFVICESDRTFSGQTKEWIFEKNLDRFADFRDKIIYNKITNAIDPNPWVNEAIQRSSCLPQVELKADDLIISSDVDEIPNPDLLKNTSWVEDQKLYVFLQLMYYYNLHTRYEDRPNGFWTGSRIVRYATIEKNNFTLSDLRHMSNRLQVVEVPNGGWHYSYFGGAESIKNKIEAFSHQEFNSDLYKNSIGDNVDAKRDLFFRDNVKLTRTPITEDFHPKYVVENADSDLIKKFI